MKKKKTTLFVAIACVVLSAKADFTIDSIGKVSIDIDNQLTLKSDSAEFKIYQWGNYMRFSYANASRYLISAKNGAILFSGDSRSQIRPVTPLNDMWSTQSLVTLQDDNLTPLKVSTTNNNANTAIAIECSNRSSYLLHGRYAANASTIGYTTFSVTGDGMLYTANSQLTLSDESHKNNIQTVSNALAGLCEVNPVSYVLNLNGDEVMTADADAQAVFQSEGDSSEAAMTENDATTDEVADETIDPAVRAAIEAERNRPKYGFVAQQIAEIFPNVVYTLPTGEKAIAYQEIIPILVSAIQELQAQVDSLKTEQTPAVPRQQAPAALAEAIADGTAALYQNVPNPFDRATEIGYRLPQGSATAMIMVCDMSGKMLESFPLAVNVTEGRLTLQAGSFAPGMYLYSLLIDGTLVDTKQMVILGR